MDPSKTTMERAFEIARSGQVADIGALRAQIKREGYVTQQLEGPSLRRLLGGLIRQALVNARSQTQ